MTNAELIHEIRNEIDLRYSEYREKMKTDDFTYYEGMADALDLFEQFLDSLESEPMNLEEEIHKYNKERFDEYFPEQDGDFISEVDFMTCLDRVARHFAQWGADHTPLPEDTVLFQKGVEEGKRLMMEEAVEGEVMTNGFYPYEPRIVAPYPNCPYDFGDKVRVIVCKKED